MEVRCIANQRVAIYCRLSEEDRDKKSKDDDSMSIQNQKDMLNAYAIDHGWSIYRIYSDDNYSGSDRNRPEFNQMIEDAKAHKFDIVLCKTQSRFTREMELVEKYIHDLFPRLGIRFVSVVDNIDTDMAGNKKARQINGLMNEWYLEDMSDSIKSALHSRMEHGHHIGAFAPYGYRKDPDRKGHLLIVEEEAEVVRMIFALYNQGIGRTQIARTLNERNIPSPSERLHRQGAMRKPVGKSKVALWKYSSVSAILENEVYIGNLVQGKTYHPTYKECHSIPAPKSKWIRVEHTHEAIIDRDTWNLTRQLWSSRSKPCYVGKNAISCGTETANENGVNLFAGKLICMHCGYHMCMAYNRHKRYYRCSTRKFDKSACEGATVFESTLKNAVLAEFKRHVAAYLDESMVENGVTVRDDSQTRLSLLKKSVSDLEKRIADCDTYVKNLYIDKIKGSITEDWFLSMSEQFRQDKENLMKERERTQEEIAVLEEIIRTARSKHEIIREYMTFDELTKPMVDILIDKIEIGGSRDNRMIQIYWNF